MESVKNYCQYLITKYDSIKVGRGGRVLLDLNQFLQEGRIKDLVEINDKIETKINILDIYRDKILFFAQSRAIDIDLKNFKEFNNENK